MLPKIALVGRPNVGKSALFNRICQKRISIVDDQEGVTRDRLYAEAEVFGQPFILIDTGGIDTEGKIPFAELIEKQAEAAVEEADAVILVVDGRVGLTTFDEEVARRLRFSKRPLFLAINKMDQGGESEAAHAFHALGIEKQFPVSAMQGHQVAELIEAAFQAASGEKGPEVVEEKKAPIRVAIVGRANVGKSTLLNRLLAEERSIVSPIPGTTRDAIDTLFVHEGEEFLLIDTAGVRRKKVEKDVVDKFAAIRTDEAIERADVCLLVLDSFEGFTIQERRIASEIEARGKSCILLFNKWDLVSNLRMEHALRSIREEVPFLGHCPVVFLSAKQGRGVEKVMPLVKEIYANRFERIGTGALNHFIERCLQKYHPPLITGKRLRIYYLSQVEVGPPRFVLFVNRPNLMTETYRKYLVNQLRKSFPFAGTPLFFELRGKKVRTATPSGE